MRMDYIKINFLLLWMLLMLVILPVSAKEYHVSVNGNNEGDGSALHPFREISFAAALAMPGDVIIVHSGEYREQVSPPRGGLSDSLRIIYRAAEGEKAVVKGSEIITGWKRFERDAWKVTIPNSFFKDYNPYTDIIAGDWFNDEGMTHHTGEVYLNGKSLFETNKLDEVVSPTPKEDIDDREGSTYTWYCETDENNTIIYANFHNYNPNKELVEINVRKSCFDPDETGINYITVSGFQMSQAATQWAPPTAEQAGLIGTHWSKGWIIENNVISNSKCCGISLGKDRASGQNVWSENPVKDGATHYNEVIFRALQDGWSRENIGSHLVRNNKIYNCEQGGIVGSLGAVFSTILNNHIYNIWTKRMFSGAEIAGIKIHAAIDVLIKNNHIHDNGGKGIWMDWMAQGTRITGNLCYRNAATDLFSEVNHGPYLVDNNIFLSESSLRDWSEGGAYVHNLFTGMIEVRLVPDRFTPYHFPHSTQVAGLRNIQGGDNRFYYNIFVKEHQKSPGPVNPELPKKISYGLDAYSIAEFPMQFGGNVYLNGAKPHPMESVCIHLPAFDPDIKTEQVDDNVFLYITPDQSFMSPDHPRVDTRLLGRTKISDLAFEEADGSSLIIDTDYFGMERKAGKSSAGPFEDIGEGPMKLKVW